MKILNFGSLNIDYVYNVDHFVRPGETISSESRLLFCGGKGLNQSIALARSGVQVYHAGAVGKADGGILCEALKKDNINTDFIEQCDSVSTGHAIIQVNSTGENCIILYGGANQTMTREHIDKALNSFDQGDFLILQNEINMLDYIIEQAHNKGIIIVLNPSPMDEKILALPLKYVDYFIFNEVEAADICGNIEQEKLLECFAQRYPSAKIVLTLGRYGVKYRDNRQMLTHGIYEVPVVDTTAAGDTFSGFFIGSLIQGYNTSEALRLASVAASISVSRHGAETSIPYMEEVKSSKLKVL